VYGKYDATEQFRAAWHGLEVYNFRAKSSNWCRAKYCKIERLSKPRGPDLVFLNARKP